jgi:hypothetical protein
MQPESSQLLSQNTDFRTVSWGISVQFTNKDMLHFNIIHTTVWSCDLATPNTGQLLDSASHLK